MHVPADAFKDEGGHSVSPERKAATALGNLFTMAATRVILDQFTARGICDSKHSFTFLNPAQPDPSLGDANVYFSQGKYSAIRAQPFPR